MIKVELDKHDLLCHIEGFANGSHLLQHIWREVVMHYIPQMSKDEIDFTWYYLHRDVWPKFFGGDTPRFGAEDFLQCMAALHRNNYYNLEFVGKQGEQNIVEAYMFQNRFYPPYSFNSFFDQTRIQEANKISLEENKYVPKHHQHWWNNTDIYNLSVEQVTQLENENN